MDAMIHTCFAAAMRVAPHRAHTVFASQARVRRTSFHFVPADRRGAAGRRRSSEAATGIANRSGSGSSGRGRRP
jgi:hypothetical protein